MYRLVARCRKVSDLDAVAQHFDTYAAIELDFLYRVIHADRLNRRHMILVNTRRVLPNLLSQVLRLPGAVRPKDFRADLNCHFLFFIVSSAI